MIFAHGSRFGGHALFLKDQKLWYVYNFLGIPPEQQFVSDTLEPGKYVLGMEFAKESHGRARRGRSARRSCTSTTRSSRPGPMRTQLAQFTLCGDGLCVGRDSARRGQRASTRRPYRFKGGTILQVEVNVGDDQYLDLERQAAAMLARE